jgi:regulator of replication initiation timing
MEDTNNFNTPRSETWQCPIDYVELQSRIAELEAENAGLTCENKELQAMLQEFADIVKSAGEETYEALKERIESAW